MSLLFDDAALSLGTQGSHYARRKGAAKGVFSAAEGIDASLEELRVYVGQGMEGDYL